MSLTQSLGNIGLGDYESEVYLALLRIGRTTAGPVIRQTGFHRQIVYTALERLKERGMVSFVIQNNRRQFSPIPPEDLLRKETERFRNFSSIVPELKALQKKVSNQLHVETFVGANELLQSLLSAVDSAARTDGVIRIMAGNQGSEFYRVIGSRYSEYVEYTRKKKVAKRLIVSPLTVQQYHDRFLKEPRAQMRVHDTGFSLQTYTLITAEMMDLAVMGDDIVTTRIWNKTIAKSYVEHFEGLWKSGKPLRRLPEV